MAYLLGGDENDVKVGTFVGYNHELGNQENGFEKNLEEYQRIFTPIIKYAEDLGVTVSMKIVQWKVGVPLVTVQLTTT
jgi:hypothetical protein